MMRKKGKGTDYRIVVRRELNDRYALAFEGMKMQTKDGDTILTGEVKDQPPLFGILDRINGLGLELLRACLVRVRVGFKGPEIGFPWGQEAVGDCLMRGSFLGFGSTPSEESYR